MDPRKPQSLALFLLMGRATAPLEPELVVIGEYERKEWKHWIDSDKDCQDARQEVLIAESYEAVTYEDERQCRVATGLWKDPYTGQEFRTPYDLDVDHVVSLRDAHDSGGYAWGSDQKEAFANDLDHPMALRAVAKGANRSKGSKGPDQWLPPNPEFRCQFIQEHAAIKSAWQLNTSAEAEAVLDYMVKICNDGLIPPLPQR